MYSTTDSLFMRTVLVHEIRRFIRSSSSVALVTYGKIAFEKLPDLLLGLFWFRGKNLPEHSSFELTRRIARDLLACFVESCDYALSVKDKIRSAAVSRIASVKSRSLISSVSMCFKFEMSRMDVRRTPC